MHQANNQFIVSLKALEKLIDRLHDSLREYAQKPDAKQAYIDKQNKLIGQLTEIYNNFENAHLSMCTEIERERENSVAHYNKGWIDSRKQADIDNLKAQMLFSEETSKNIETIEKLHGVDVAITALNDVLFEANSLPDFYNPPHS